MTTGESALVLVQPTDSIEAIVTKARNSGAQSVELLVPADTGVLQEWRNLSIVQQALAQSGIEAVVISSDAAVLQAARDCNLTTIAVEGANVVGPLIAQPQRRKRPVPNTLPKPDQSSDLALLDLLEQETSVRQPVRDQAHVAYSGADADFLASLDDLGVNADPPATPVWRVPLAEPAKAAESDTIPIRATVATAPRAAIARASVAEAANRVRPRRSTRSEAEPRSSVSARRARARDQQQAQRSSRSLVSPLLIASLGVIVVAGVALFWAFNSRVSIAIAAPDARVRELPIVNQVIPYSATPTGDTPTILAAPIVAEAEFTAKGQVQTTTTSPTGKAKGQILVINTIDQALSLPAGTEFVGRNPQGAEVRFIVDAPLQVPGATSSATLSGRSTVYGQATVAVTARSAGAASNVPENTVKQILIPGQPLINCGTSNFICQNGEILGGTDEPQWVVTEADARQILGEALTGLYNSGVQQLRAQTDGAQSTVDASSISPSPAELGDPKMYEPVIVDPPIGQPADPNTREFSVTVRTRFVALAVRPDQMLQDQLAKSANTILAQSGSEGCSAAEIAQPKLDTWTWDGTSLRVNGLLQCSPRGALGPETRLMVREALRGKSRAEAEAALRELQLQSLIGEFSIPAGVEQLPPLDILLDVQFAGE